MERSYRIAANGVLTYGRTLRLGSANFFVDDYTGVEGKHERGPTALLVMWRADDPALPPQEERVHVGQRLTFNGYEIIVVSVDDGGRFLEVEINQQGSKIPGRDA
ncbi:MAG: hypothetical protein PVI59_13750 [Anaerolineae bacterium]|jgi:hypothetical protein